MWISTIQYTGGPKKTNRLGRILSSRALSTADAGMAELLVLEPGSCGTGTRLSPSSQAFRLTYATTSFRGSPDQFADNTLWDFLASIDAQVNPYEEPPRLFCVYILFALVLWRAMTRTMTLCHRHGLSVNPSQRINTTKIEGTLKIPKVCYELCKQHCALPRGVRHGPRTGRTKGNLGTLGHFAHEGRGGVRSRTEANAVGSRAWGLKDPERAAHQNVPQGLLITLD